MEKIVVATSNAKKCKEILEILQDIELLTLKDIGDTTEIEENGKTFTENAFIKARTIFKYLKGEYTVIADDSGLCVYALNYAPSIYSARYSGVQGEGKDRANNELLLKNMQGITDRRAFFETAIAVCHKNGQEFCAVGRTEGEIMQKVHGDNGFGYDPLFFSYDLQKTFAEATSEEKNSVSHRKRALEQVAKYLQDLYKNK